MTMVNSGLKGLIHPIILIVFLLNIVGGTWYLAEFAYKNTFKSSLCVLSVIYRIDVKYELSINKSI